MPVVYLPIEIKHRELDPRLRTAAHLLDRRVSVVIGQQWSVFANAKNFPEGVILFKTMNAIQGRNMALFKKHGHRVAGMDEECLCCVSDSRFLSGVDKSAVENCDLFFAQSETHARAVNLVSQSLSVKVTGNPRMDFENLSQIKSRGAVCRSKHGPYVLFNMNYGAVNSVWGLEGVRKVASDAGVDPENFQANFKWELRNLTEMHKLLGWAVNNLPQKIVVRPHPAEVPDYWKKIYGDKIFIPPNSEPHHWMMGAELTVHTGCTTGMEAAVLGCPVLNMEVEDKPGVERAIQSTNYTVNDWKEAKDAILRFLEDKRTLTNPKSARALREQFSYGDSAKRQAEGLLGLFKGLKQERSGFDFRVSVQRPDIFKNKFSMSAEEFANQIKPLLKTENIEMGQLDDSLFLLKPAPKEHPVFGWAA